MALRFLERLDRRYIYLLIIIISTIIVLHPLGLPLPLSTRTKDFYNVVSLYPGGSALLELEAGTSEIGVPEQLPIAIAVVKHLVALRYKLVFFTGMGIDDADLMVEMLDNSGDMPMTKSGYVYGKDWVIIGWIGGSEPGMNQFARDIVGYKPYDFRTRPLKDMPIFANLKTIKDFNLWFLMAREADTPASAMRAIEAPYGMPAMLITSSSLAGEFTSYVMAGQGRAVCIGARGGAEYESLLGYKGLGSSTTDALSAVTVFSMITIVIGNLTLLEKRGTSTKQAKEGV